MNQYVTMEKLCKAILSVFFILYLLIATLTPPNGWGELSSFEIPIISLVEHGDFEVRETDYQHALQWFSTHRNVLEVQYKLFPVNHDGVRYPWYFGLYAPLCIPVFLFLKLLHLKTVYTLPITNALCLFFALWGIYHYWNADIKQKLFTILFFGIGEMSLWVELTTESYEVAMTSLTILASVFWVNRERKQAAFFLSLAGTMNSTVMAFGIFMIVDYFYEMFVASDESWTLFVKNCKEQWKFVLEYAVCFSPCLFPMVVSYLSLGQFVAMASAGQVDGIWERFLAYLVDLNFGLFPYIPLFLPLFVFVCLKSREIWLKWTFIGVLATILSYSLVFHINCGMPGIHRYNEWLLPMIVIPTIAYMNSVFSSVVARRYMWVIAWFSLLWCAGIMSISNHSHYVSWLPLARAALDYAPQLYNPLPSTFYSRTCQVGGGYDIKAPVIYSAMDGYVRKVLVPPGMVEQVREALYIPSAAESIFAQQYEQIKSTNEYNYFNFPGKAHILKIPEAYTLGEEVFFDGSPKDGHRYFLHGLSITEKDFVWTDGKRALLRLKIPETVTQDLLLTLHIRGTFYCPQRLIASCGKAIVFNQTLPMQEQPQSIHIQIPKECVLRGVVEVSLEFPNAVAPVSVKYNQDPRELAVALTSFSVSQLEGSEQP